mmetsp:Transcript_24750/g.79952  ORF Transcript_24750/g.79952 Transcript_24750/m.79952 type:complete len:539 (+) Transcript_24750:65-1681(+)|eukprot:scaffold19052_cov117-Isochrysis_galbana.AAC.2
MATADQSAADAVVFQRFLHARQFPVDCRNTTGVLTWGGSRPGADGRAGAPYPNNYFYVLGFGAQMISIKFNFLSALLTPDAVYHFPTSHYANPIRCPSRTFECYFAPISNCTVPPLLDAQAKPSTSRRLQARVGGNPSSTGAKKGIGRRRLGVSTRRARRTEGREASGTCSPRDSRSVCRMSPADATAHARLKFEKILWCTDTPRRRLSRLAGLTYVHSKAWYHAQLADFLFRPNGEMRRLRANVSAELQLGTVNTSQLGKYAAAPRHATAAARHAATTVAASPWPRQPSAAFSCAAMHVRRTDKKTEDHRWRGTADFRPYASAYRAWSYWGAEAGPLDRRLAIGPDGNAERGRAEPPRVLLGSEDKATFATMPTLLAPAEAWYIPHRYFVMDMSDGNQFKHIKQGNARLAERYGALEDERDAAARSGAAALRAFLARPGSTRDEGMALALQILMMGECAALFGPLSSNVDVLVSDLQLARATRLRTRYHVFDPNSRSYCGCGASFCMVIERAQEADPTRGYPSMVQAMKGDVASVKD